MTAGKRYSAGAIFLQVVPVFTNIQRAIEDEAENIDRALGDRMEKSGAKAGERAGKAASKKMTDEFRKGSVDMERDFKRSVESMGNALDDIDMGKLKSHVKREVAAITQELAKIHDVDLTVDANFKDAHTRLAALQKQIDAIQNDIPLVFHPNLIELSADLKRVKAMLASIDNTIDVEVNVDDRQLGKFEKRLKDTVNRASKQIDGSLNPALARIKQGLDDLSKKRIGIDISGEMAMQELRDLQRAALELSLTSPDIQVRTDAAASEAVLAGLIATTRKLDGTDVVIDIRARDRASGELRRSSRNADQAANSFRSFNVILFAATTAGPALVPILGAIAGGLLALGPAAAVAVASLGAVAVGFSGIGGALQALGNQQDQAAMTAQTAARSEASAAKAVADARRSAARAIEAALDRQRDAQKRYKESINDVREAEQALRDARAAASNNGEEIGRAVRENGLAIDQGVLDLFDATTQYNAAQSDGSATNAEKEQARINMEEAKLRLEELRAQRAELAAEQKKWDEEGVEGTEEVQSAQDALSDAIDAQKEAYEDLGDAARDVDEARADGARQVAAALDSQAQAMEGLNAQQNAVDQAFAKMGASGQAFTLFLFGLRDEFRNFRNDIQDVLLPSVQEAIEGFLGSKNGGIARGALIALADSFGRFVKALSASFQGQAWQDFFIMLGTVGPQIQDAWGGAFIALMEGIASIMTTSAPFALMFARGLERMMESFANWAASEEGKRAVLDFLEWVQEYGPEVLDFLGAFVIAAKDLAVALAPLGLLVLDGLTGFFETLSAMDPQVLSALATGLVLLIGASQTAYLVMNLLLVGGTLLASTVGLFVFAFAGLLAAFAFLYKTNEGFADFIDDAWDRISKAVMGAWEDSLKPALEELGAALMELWDEVLLPFLQWLGPKLVWFIEHVLPLLMKWWGFLAKAIAFAITKVIIPYIKLMYWIISPVFRRIGRALEWLWDHVFEPFVDWVKENWPLFAATIRQAWEQKIKPIWDKMTSAVGALRTAFRRAVSGIKTIWGGLREAIGAPIRFVVNTLLRDGLVAGINKVLKFVKLGQISFPGIPSGKADETAGGAAGGGAGGIAMATGGILPGHTPGRDVHHFHSPTAGNLHLSGGEAIMRPEWTKAVGSGFVNQMNALARKGGARAVQAAMMGRAFAKGGVFWPLPNSSASTYTGHDGVDLNAPNDLGKPYFSATSGKVTTTGYGRGYGNAVFIASPYGELVYGHSLDGSIAVRPGQAVRAGQYLAKVGSTGNSSGPHLHFGYPGGTYEAAMALLRGAAQIPAGEIGRAGGPSFPKWIMDVARNPLGYVKGLVADPIAKLKSQFDPSPMISAMVGIPGQLVNGVKDRIWDILPGPVKAAVKGADKALDPGSLLGAGLDAVTPDVERRNGGILPYNGTMKYDAGGYLPPGLTTVMNLTGKPEPVFTDRQFKDMGRDGGDGTLHYEPHFEGSNLTSEDVAADLNFTFRRIRRRGKYAGVGDQ